MNATDQTFKAADIVIDGNEYRQCRFDRCKLIYRGGELPVIVDCNFQDCGWAFEDAAERTLVFMKLVYHGMGERGPEMIEATVSEIRKPIAKPE